MTSCNLLVVKNNTKKIKNKNTPDPPTIRGITKFCKYKYKG